MLLAELKSQATTFNLLFVMLALAFFLYQKKRVLPMKICISTTIILFLLASTGFLPHYAVSKLEGTYGPIDLEHIKIKNSLILIHVLGGGHSPNPDLPPNAQLALETLGRLTEGLRIARHLPGSLLVTSGGSSLANETQASVVRRAAISIGFDSTRIMTLDEPGTTQEEAEALANLFGTNAQVIVVTDGIHMPRAIRLFQDAGFQPNAAPTNFLIKRGAKRPLQWWPSVRNISLTDQWLHEFLGNVKTRIFYISEEFISFW